LKWIDTHTDLLRIEIPSISLNLLETNMPE
jgi:hypothetical protein